MNKLGSRITQIIQSVKNSPVSMEIITGEFILVIKDVEITSHDGLKALENEGVKIEILKGDMYCTIPLEEKEEG